ncbi:unnamed protein product [Arabidopsis thaliana]|uniref:Uncharacterized protein n=1 Tax=Arabidopsis thaliana TaxID=3702 RepID=A0A5S9SNG2_ARATH|nr:unnamed protein product [Arabidopsis thaliana]VYS45051.1 unnamed protein product [Arabidopsis thaliana]
MVKPRWTADVRNIETCKWNKWSIVVNVILVNIRLKLTVIRGQKTNKASVWSSQEKKEEGKRGKKKQIKRLHLLLTVKESAMDVPSNLESRRRLTGPYTILPLIDRYDS